MDLFVTGCSRGGTTLVQSILAAHPSYTSFPETNILYKLFGDLEFRRFGTLIGHRSVPKALAYQCLHATGYTVVDPAPVFQKWLGDMQRNDLQHFIPYGYRSLKKIFTSFEAVLDELAADKNWIEKTPQNVFYIEYLDKYFSDKGFVHVIRDAEPTVASILSAASKYRVFASRFGGLNGFDRALEYWKRSVRSSMRMLGKANHLFLRYEDVATNPLTALAPVSHTFKLTVSGDMLSYSKEGITFEDEVWKHTAGGIFPPANKAHDILTAAQREQIRNETRSILQAFPRQFN